MLRHRHKHHGGPADTRDESPLDTDNGTDPPSCQQALHSHGWNKCMQQITTIQIVCSQLDCTMQITSNVATQRPCTVGHKQAKAQKELSQSSHKIPPWYGKPPLAVSYNHTWG